MKQAMQVLTSSLTNEWYTPYTITDMAREVMGHIGLDPASDIAAQSWILAGRYYTAEEDGSLIDWYGNIWLNPPYGRVGRMSSQEYWMRKVLRDYQCGRVSSAIVLTKTVPGYKWWDKLFNDFIPVCITRGRLSFANGVVVKHFYDQGLRGRELFDVAVVAQTEDLKLMSSLFPNFTNPLMSGTSKAASSLWYLGSDPGRFCEVFSTIGRVIL